MLAAEHLRAVGRGAAARAARRRVGRRPHLPQLAAPFRDGRTSQLHGLRNVCHHDRDMAERAEHNRVAGGIIHRHTSSYAPLKDNAGAWCAHQLGLVRDLAALSDETHAIPRRGPRPRTGRPRGPRTGRPGRWPRGGGRRPRRVAGLRLALPALNGTEGTTVFLGARAVGSAGLPDVPRTRTTP
ncbi:hypothetical protein GCM10020295_34340 [Streptomyces cinereospinus]